MRRLRRSRAAFTLVELLIVMAILVVLAALTTAGVMRWVDTMAEQQAITRVQAIHQVLTEQWKKVVADADKEELPSAVFTFAGSDQARARVILKYVRLIEAFPINFDEIDNRKIYSSISLADGDKKYLNNYYTEASTRKSANTSKDVNKQSSACLAMALRKARTGKGTADLDSWAKDTDGDGLPELVDDWGQPIAFFRFPVGDGSDTVLTELKNRNNTKAGRKFANPLDPDGKLIPATWPNRKTFEGFAHKIAASTSPPVAYYTVPVIVSAGVDQKMGLTAKTMATQTNPAPDDTNGTPPYWQDNLFSYKLQLGQAGTSD